MKNVLTIIGRLAIFLLAAIALVLTPLVLADDHYLAPEVAFKFSARVIDAKTVEVNYLIADGYYMYRERFAFKADGARLGKEVIPPGKVKFDETFQKNVETYRGAVTISIPVEAYGPFTLTAVAQGCADAGLCYPPMESMLELTSVSDGKANAVITDAAVASDRLVGTETGRIEASLISGKLIVIVPLFLLLGLGLAFTPCVLPMVPILSAIIVGDGAGCSRGRSLLLSVAYALGMALVYTILGIAAGLAGEGLAASLQNAWVLGAFSVLMVALSLSMFGLYQLQMPAAIQARLLQTSGLQGGGKLAGVFVMGALSALIVGPCVAAPLAGTLIYLSHTRDVLIGGSALFAMAVGMSIPLILIGASAGVLLPRAGAWMDGVKRFFGVLMLATALWMIAPVIPVALQMMGWAALGIGYATHLFLLPAAGWSAKISALVFVSLGLVQLAGSGTGGQDVLAPLAHLMGAKSRPVEFGKVKSVEELHAILANTQGRMVMLDFYADWCVSCKEMEKFTFSDPAVQSHFSEMLLLKADVTANDINDKALLKRFKLFGPPGIIFFDERGSEVSEARVIGYQNSKKFLRSLALARHMQVQ